jgi:hypothetical protein
MRPVVLGMNNPHSDDPQDVLSPRFPGSAGCRLYQMVRDVDPTVSEADYLAYLDRRNLVTDGDWSRCRAAKSGAFMVESLVGLNVVMLGTLVPPALKLRYSGAWYEWTTTHTGMRYCVVPHPSGLNRIYNDVAYRQRTGGLLVDLILDARRRKL